MEELNRAREEMTSMLHLVPYHLREGVLEYCLVGRPIGHFLSAVMANDLREAVARGDTNSLAGLKGLCQFLHNYSPPGCWGSRDRFIKWQDGGGLAGALRAARAEEKTLREQVAMRNPI